MQFDRSMKHAKTHWQKTKSCLLVGNCKEHQKIQRQDLGSHINRTQDKRNLSTTMTFGGGSSSSIINSNRDQVLAITATVLAVTLTFNVARPIFARLASRMKLQRDLAKKKESSSQGDGSVSGIFIHPVKSLRAVSVDKAEMDEKGLAGDRRYMVVYPIPLPVWKESFGPNDATHRFMTQRQCPSFATIVAKVDEGKKILSLTCGEKSIEISTKPPSPTATLRAGIWGDEVEVVDMGDEVAGFLQSIVNSDDNCKIGDEGDGDGDGADGNVMYKNVRLVFHAKNDRLTDPTFVSVAAKKSNVFGTSSPPVSLTDGYPILIACETSLNALNEKLKSEGKEAIPMSRFRPNIVISGTKTPFEEDRWKVIAIGDQLFSVAKACPRCKQSCTDQETGKVTSEPVAVMKKFRALGGNSDDVFFAQNAIAISGNGKSIRVGDKIHILETGDPVYC